MAIEINGIEHIITINTNHGTAEVAGHLAKVNGFPVSMYMKADEGSTHKQLVVCDVKTGTVISRIGVNMVEFWWAETKEQAMHLFSEKLKLLEPSMNNNLIREIKEKRSAYPEVKEPQSIDDYDEFVKGFMKGAET